VSPIREESTWKRQDLILKDDNSTILVKLWNDKADVHVTNGNQIKLTNVTTDLYRDVLSVQSTDETNCEVYYTCSN